MAGLVRWDPLPAASLRDEIDRLFGRALLGGGRVGAPWAPASDVYETDDALVITAELPGVKDEDIDISVHDGVLTIGGERRLHDEVREEGVHRLERSYGSFTRQFRLPPGTDSDDVKASVAYGVLRVTIPKRQAAKPQKVPVTAGG